MPRQNFMLNARRALGSLTQNMCFLDLFPSYVVARGPRAMAAYQRAI